MQQFEFSLEDNLFALREALITKTYAHGLYQSFYVRDPKLRHIHKASVGDRVLHQAVFRILYPIFDKSFIFDSYSCRIGKGTHRAVSRLETFAWKLSRNHTRTIFALKGDVKKFFDSVRQEILLRLLEGKIADEDTLRLIQKIIHSFETHNGRGLPLGNVTSQLFANIYLNELDQFVKHKLKIRYYIRYCDDFIVLVENENDLWGIADKINSFLSDTLGLFLHQGKVNVRKYNQGIDFLGYVVLPHYRVLRAKTKRRMFHRLGGKRTEVLKGKLNGESLDQSFQSYLGVLKHCNGFKIKRQIAALFE